MKLNQSLMDEHSRICNNAYNLIYFAHTLETKASSKSVNIDQIWKLGNYCPWIFKTVLNVIQHSNMVAEFSWILFNSFVYRNESIKVDF